MQLKKIAAILTAGILTASLAACGSSGSGSGSSGETSPAQTAQESEGEQAGEAASATEEAAPAEAAPAEEAPAEAAPAQEAAEPQAQEAPAEAEEVVEPLDSSGKEPVSIAFAIEAPQEAYYAGCWQSMTDYVAKRCPWISFTITYSAEAETPSGTAADLRGGQTDMTLVTPSDLSGSMPEAELIGACYLFDDREQINAVLNEGEVGQTLRETAAQKAGIRLLGAASSGSRQISLAIDRKVETREDLDGVLLRVPVGNSWVQMGEAIGCMPNPMPLSQIGTALDMGLIQGLDSTLPEITDNALEERVKSVSITNHSFGVFWVALREEMWQSFDAQTQEAFQEGFRRAEAQCRNAGAASDAEMTAQLRDLGISVHDNLNLTKMSEEVWEFY